MQVLAIIGSPRQGHSYQLTQQIERRLTQNADVQFEYVFLGELNLQPCHGCYVCQSRGEQFCPIHDDRADLVQRMQQADGVVFVSPTYTANVSGLMKNLMDRMAYTAHRPVFLGKPAMLVSTASGDTTPALKALGWFHYTGFEIVSKLGVPVWPSPRRAWHSGQAAERKLDKAVQRFAKALSRRPASLSLMQVFYFYLMKASAESDPAFFPADYEYHKSIGSLNLEVSPWKDALGKLCYRIAFRWMDRHLTHVHRRNAASPEYPRCD